MFLSSAVAMVAAATEGGDDGQLAVTFYSEPTAASLHSPATGLLGVMPLTVYYPVPQPWRDCVTLEPLVARWASGADTRIEVTACPDDGRTQHHVVLRPPLAAGGDVDAWFAGKVIALGLVAAPDSGVTDPRLAGWHGSRPVAALMPASRTERIGRR